VVAELSWITRLLAEFNVASITPVPVHCDNQAAIYIARNPVFHERIKHIELDCHFVREKLMTGLITLHYVPSQTQLADVLTKPLSGPSHRDIIRKLGVLAPPNLRGVLENEMQDVTFSIHLAFTFSIHLAYITFSLHFQPF